MSAAALQRMAVRVQALLDVFAEQGTVPSEELRRLKADLDQEHQRADLEEQGRGFDAEAANHFLRLARTGKRGTASGGEARCFRLASMLRKNLDDCCGLDSSAQQGFIEVFRAANVDFYTVQGWLKGMDGRRR